VTISHVTALPERALFNLNADSEDAKIVNFTFINNLVAAGDLEITSSGGGRKNCAYKAGRMSVKEILDSCFSNPSLTHNIIVGSDKEWPKGNVVIENLNTTGFAKIGGHNLEDYQLLPNSPAKRAGSDGKDIGADIDAIVKATAGVR
jgi:hypothetical protein